ncbi:hypothetical protein BDW74DRAFT_40560 [Aspergillus multicolor]|uniref:uncharacterized protein n=1 Tax=Aspergillus multicolor TaxID=41759 RepID=UPI003CCE44B0
MNSVISQRTSCPWLSLDINIKPPAAQIQSSASPFASFLTGEKIEGTVSIISQRDFGFDRLHISFVGEESTIIPSSNPDKAKHQFLELVQPIHDSVLPSSKVFIAKRQYEIPFSFEVPDYLPSSSCRHSSDPLVKAAHLHLPPSCGDASIAGFGGKLRDDFAPAACKVVYSVYAKIECFGKTFGNQETIADKRLKVRIKPAVGDVPLPDLQSMNNSSSEYSIHHELTIHGGSSKSKSPVIGRLAMTLEQPGCFYHPLRDPIRLISKAIRIFLVYTPSTSDPTALPPELKSLKTQITATTVYTTKLDNAPHPLPKKRDFLNRPSNFRDAELPLSIPSTPRLGWLQGQTGAYTATLLVPVTLPKDKSFIPTFYSCLISRVYSLRFQLSVQGSPEPFRLKAPMQIAAERDPAALPSYNASLGIIDME